MRHAQGKAPEVTSTALTAMRRLYCSPDIYLRRLCMSRHHSFTPAFQRVKVNGKSVDQGFGIQRRISRYCRVLFLFLLTRMLAFVLDRQRKPHR